MDQPYRFRYVKGRDHHLHGAAAGLRYTQVLDCPDLGLAQWISFVGLQQARHLP